MIISGMNNNSQENPQTISGALNNLLNTTKEQTDLLNITKEQTEITEKFINLDTTKINEPVETSVLIYNSENYKSKIPMVQFIAMNKETGEVILDEKSNTEKVSIWLCANMYSHIDFFNSNNDFRDFLNKIKYFLSRYNNTSLYIRIYPDSTDKECYIKLTNIAIFPEVVTTLSQRLLSQITTEKNITIYCDKKNIKNITVPFEDIIKVSEEITEEDKLFIKKIINKQNDPNWFVFHKKEPKKQNRVKTKVKEPPKQQEMEVQTSNDEIFDPSILKVISGSDDPMKDLENIIGLDNIKHEIEKLKYTLEYKEERRKRGIHDGSASSMHMCFYGSPGTGKTTVARIMTGLLYEMGYIKENKCIEINGLEFKGGYVGQTEIITKSILDYSKGGILFVDEAYALCGINDSYGQEAVNTFIKEMEDNRDELIIIFAGYEDAMETFLNTNSGFRSRINRYFKFENYTTNQLIEIMIRQLKNKHLKIEEEALEKVLIIFKTAQKFNDFGNGRFVTNLIEKVEEEHIMNVIGIEDINRIDTITLEDVSDKVEKALIDSLKR